MRKDMKVEYGESFLRVADPVVDGFIKASSTSVTLPCAPVDGDVLISLEVNGTVVARRELFTMVEGSVTVGDYTVEYANGAVTISTTKSNDVVEIRIEPVEVVISDAFRAAVNETAPQTPNELPAVGSDDKGKFLHTNDSTGAVEWAGAQEQEFIVHLTPTSESGGTMDKSNVEILAAYTQGKRIMFDIALDNISCRVQATLSAAFEGFEYPSFNAYGIDTSGTTIINLYVDPSDEESYTFSMDAQQIGGGGNNPYEIVVFHPYNEGGQKKMSCDHTYAQILALYNDGVMILGVMESDNFAASVLVKMTYGTGPVRYFGTEKVLGFDNNKLFTRDAAIYADETIDYIEQQITLT